MRVFFSTGEASGELLAADLLGAMRARTAIDAEGIGSERLEGAGVRIVQCNRGWASLGVFEAVRRLPLTVGGGLKVAWTLWRDPPDLVVLVDFGAFNLRLAGLLRMLGFSKPIVYYVPPSAWIDKPKKARKVASLCDALTIFRHQADFYRSLGLPIAYFGHPLVSVIGAREPRPAPPPSAGLVALLPGSRADEIARHTQPLLDALARVREVRPEVRAMLVAADDAAYEQIAHFLSLRSPLPVEIVRDARAALAGADAAAVASGTAVLEAALIETPAVALYVVSKAQAAIARRVYRGKYFTLPNLVLDEPIVPELLQSAATPAALADGLLALLANPQAQLAGYARMRAALDAPDALQRNADWVLAAVPEMNRAPVPEQPPD